MNKSYARGLLIGTVVMQIVNEGIKKDPIVILQPYNELLGECIIRGIPVNEAKYVLETILNSVIQDVVIFDNKMEIKWGANFFTFYNNIAIVQDKVAQERRVHLTEIADFIRYVFNMID
jgi:hypothetical protein